ncbi:MAG: hypothetical protein K6T66_06490 [Peptococcaceae bacterium]|nr:hypothetical protein [Peptococcaceae bacterium]
MAELWLEGLDIICVEPEGSWVYETLQAIVSTDKYLIASDGVDVAIVTANVEPTLTEITFHHTDTGEPIATMPVDPKNRTATLQITATTPGTIRIRAGEPTITRLNEVTIYAVEAG